MKVTGLGVGTEFKDLPAGSLFWTTRGDTPPLACIKTSTALEDKNDGLCVVLFPPKAAQARGPAVARFKAWFGAVSVLHLDEVHLVWESGSLSFSDGINIGHVIFGSGACHMVVQHNHDTNYLNLNNGQLLSSAPVSPPWPSCNRWSLQWKAPDMVKLDGCSFGK